MRINDSFLHGKDCPPRQNTPVARERYVQNYGAAENAYKPIVKTNKIKFETLQNAIEEVDGYQKTSDKLAEDAVLGRVENLHDVMIAAEKARTTMNLTLEVRNKALEAYKEIMRLNF